MQRETLAQLPQLFPGPDISYPGALYLYSTNQGGWYGGI